MTAIQSSRYLTPDQNEHLFRRTADAENELETALAGIARTYRAEVQSAKRHRADVTDEARQLHREAIASIQADLMRLELEQRPAESRF